MILFVTEFGFEGILVLKFIVSGANTLKICNQFKMEVAPTETGLKPKSYSMNMSKDFIPMCVFSEANQGKDQKLDFLINRIRYEN